MSVKYRPVKRTNAVIDEEQYQEVAEQWRAGKASAGGWSFNLKYREKSGLSESGSGADNPTYGVTGQYGGVVSPDYSDGIVAAASRPLVLAQVLRTEETSSNLVRIVRGVQDSGDSGSSSGYTAQPAGTGTDGSGQTAEGTQYGETDEQVTPHDYGLVDTTTVFPVTEDFLMDVPSAMAYITKRVSYLVCRAEEANLVQGTGGSSTQMVGLTNTTGDGGEVPTTPTANYATYAPGGTTVATAVASLIAATYDASGCDPEWVLCSADTWAAYAVQSPAAGGQYVAGYPNTPGRTMWGLPVVLSANNTGLANKIVIGSSGAVGRWVHTSGVKVDVSPGYSTYFGQGMVAVRAKIRSTLAYEHPSGIGILTATTAF
jgi:HK97 family phage major capsid protein